MINLPFKKIHNGEEENRQQTQNFGGEWCCKETQIPGGSGGWSWQRSGKSNLESAKLKKFAIPNTNIDRKHNIEYQLHVLQFGNWYIFWWILIFSIEILYFYDII